MNTKYREEAKNAFLKLMNNSVSGRKERKKETMEILNK